MLWSSDEGLGVCLVRLLQCEPQKDSHGANISFPSRRAVAAAHMLAPAGQQQHQQQQQVLV